MPYFWDRKEYEIVVALDQGGPSAGRSARSTKAEDKASPPGGRTKTLPDDRPPLPNGEEPSASPLAGRRRRPPLIRLYMPGPRYSSPTGGGREPAEVAHCYRHQRHGEDEGCSCGRASRRCHKSFLTGIFGTSVMAAPLCPLPFPGRRPGTMPAEGPPASSPAGDPSLHWEGRKEGLSPLQGGKLTSECISPSRKKEAYERRCRTCLEGHGHQARGGRIPQGDLLSTLGNAHGGRAAEVHYDGLAEGIITAAGAVMIGQRCPIFR
jgi:hypothetical protein